MYLSIVIVVFLCDFIMSLSAYVSVKRVVDVGMILTRSLSVRRLVSIRVVTCERKLTVASAAQRRASAFAKVNDPYDQTITNLQHLWTKAISEARASRYLI